MDRYKSIELAGRQQRRDHIDNRSIVSSRPAYGLKISDRFRIVEIPPASITVIRYSPYSCLCSFNCHSL